MRRSLAVLFFCSSASFAEDLGQIGNVYPIVERNLIDVFKSRAQARIDDGTWNKLMDKQRDALKKYVEHPIGLKLPRAEKYGLTYYDPTMVLGQDIVDASGKLLYAKGTKVNPLDYRQYSRTLCFIDGEDDAQVQWVKKHCLDPVQAKIILVDGPILDISRTLNVPLYFDQYGILIRHFGVKAVPSVIRQSGRAFAIEEFGVSP